MPEIDKAVIFDLDGVLTDTIEPHYLSWQALMNELGVPFDRDLNDRLRGLCRAESLEIILGKRSGDFTPEHKRDIMRRKNDVFLALVAKMSPADLYPGAGELLRDLKQRGVPLAVASSSRNADVVLRQIGAREYFDVVLDANDVTESKPDPAVFFEAARRLGTRPECCVVIEDGVAGVEAALRANMAVVGLGPPERVARAHIIRRVIGELTTDELLAAPDRAAASS